MKKQLEAQGHEVTSRWLEEDTPLNHSMEDVTSDYAAKSARYDLEDIDEADAVLFFSESVLTPRGGRHVEFGYALAKDKWIYVIGPAENIFHYGDPFIANIPNVESLAPVQVVGF